MTGHLPNTVARRMMRHFALAVLLFSGLTAATSSVGAFCIENNADERLLFMAKPRDHAGEGWPFRQWLKPGGKTCGKPDSGITPVEVFVFVDEEALEGCDRLVAPVGVLRLKSFIEFDRCAWSE